MLSRQDHLLQFRAAITQKTFPQHVKDQGVHIFLGITVAQRVESASFLLKKKTLFDNFHQTIRKAILFIYHWSGECKLKRFWWKLWSRNTQQLSGIAIWEESTLWWWRKTSARIKSAALASTGKLIETNYIRRSTIVVEFSLMRQNGPLVEYVVKQKMHLSSQRKNEKHIFFQ